MLRKRLPASKTERIARQASPKTDQWMCTKLEKEEKIKGSDKCEKEEKRIKGVIQMNKKKKKKKPQKQRQKSSKKSCGCFNSPIQMARTLIGIRYIEMTRRLVENLKWKGKQWQEIDMAQTLFAADVKHFSSDGQMLRQSDVHFLDTLAFRGLPPRLHSLA